MKEKYTGFFNTHQDILFIFYLYYVDANTNIYKR